MWFLIDESGEKVSEFFPSQAKLAVFMQMLPQTLNRAIQKGKNVFQFRGQEVKVVQQTIPHFADFDFPPSEGTERAEGAEGSGKNPIETFELIPEVAKWLQVSNQTVHAAIKRGDETKIKNKEGTVFWLTKLEAELGAKNAVGCSPTPISQPQPPVPLPRRKVPPSIPQFLQFLFREEKFLRRFLHFLFREEKFLRPFLQFLQFLQFLFREEKFLHLSLLQFLFREEKWVLHLSLLLSFRRNHPQFHQLTRLQFLLKLLKSLKLEKHFLLKRQKRLNQPLFFLQKRLQDLLSLE